MTPVSIRPACESDVDDVVQLTAQLGYDVDAAVLRGRLQRILARPDQRFLVAVVEGRPAGWLHVTTAEYVEAARFAVIAGLVVDQGHRRLGIGRALIERAEAWALEQGCPVVRLWSTSSRAGAHRFYERLGYTNIKTQYSFAKSLDPAGRDTLNTLVPRVTRDA